MSAGKELWGAVFVALTANPSLMVLVDGVHDKAPKEPWKAKNAYITRGPMYGTSVDAECIPGQEITLQLDVWSRKTNRWSVDDVIAEIRSSLHEQDLQLNEMALATLEVRLWRVVDDPDPTQQHGIVQVLAVIEEPL